MHIILLSCVSESEAYAVALKYNLAGKCVRQTKHKNKL